MRLGNRMLVLLFQVIDLTLLCISITIVSILHYGSLPAINDVFYLLNISWIVTYIFFLDLGFFDIPNILVRTKNLLKKFFVFLGLAAIAMVALNLDHISRTMLLGSSLCFLAFKFPATYLYTYLIAIRKDGPYNTKILIIGAGKVGKAIYAYYKMNPNLGTPVGFLDDAKIDAGKLPILGRTEDFQEVYNRTPFHEVIITIDLTSEDQIKSLVNKAEYNGVRPSIVANYYSLFNRNFELKSFAGIPIVDIREVPLDSYIPRFWKRIFDIVFAFFALLITAPILFIIAVAIKLDSKGPVFYKPIRMGRGREKFLLYKFRSMRHVKNNQNPTRSTAVNDERITSVGKFIRKYSLDELPQFINVLLGQMSVVGPRPHRVELDNRFQQIAQHYQVRQYIKPGITGWAQVNGWRGPTETKYQYIARTLHDLWYIEHWNFALDIYIILLTVFGKKTSRNAF